MIGNTDANVANLTTELGSLSSSTQSSLDARERERERERERKREREGGRLLFLHSTLLFLLIKLHA